jgi:flagellar hook-associated protein 3 FlgL
VNDVDGVAVDQTQMDAVLSKVLKALGDVGARAAQLETTEQSVQSEQLDFTSRISENEDVDLPYTIMNLQTAQVAYQASLGAAAKVMQTSLLDFLR